MLFFVVSESGDNLVEGFTTTVDEAPGENNPIYVSWQDVPVVPSFESEDDALERVEEVTGKIIGDGALVEPAPAPPVYVDRLTVIEFRRRFTAEERATIYSSEDANIKMFLDDLSVSSFVKVTDPLTIAGIDYLISASLIDPDRKSELLAVIELSLDSGPV